MVIATLAQMSMALWLLGVLGTFLTIAVFPRIIRLDRHQVQRLALYGAAGAIGEIATLLVGGFWG